MAVKNDKERKPFGMPTFEEFYRFLKSYYLHSRFEARNTEGWGLITHIVWLNLTMKRLSVMVLGLSQCMRVERLQWSNTTNN